MIPELIEMFYENDLISKLQKEKLSPQKKDYNKKFEIFSEDKNKIKKNMMKEGCTTKYSETT